MHDPDRDALLDAALSHLTTVRAPETLLPRVLAATQGLASRPWYARAWDTWPVAYQRASVAICLLVLAAMTLTVPAPGGWRLDDASALAGGRFEAWVRGAEAISNTTGSLWQELSVPLLIYASAVGVLLCLLMGLFALALNHLTPGKAFSR